MLHAYELRFYHPFTNELIELLAPLPPDIASLMSKISDGNLETIRALKEMKDDTANNNKDLDRCLSSSLIDKNSLLTCTTEVSGHIPGEKKLGGFVPVDRLVIEQDDFTSFDLPEEPLFDTQIRT